MNPELEKLIQTKGRLEVTYSRDDGGMGYNWCATLGGEWPYCHGISFDNAVRTLVSEHRRLERETLQKRIAEIDGSAQL